MGIIHHTATQGFLCDWFQDGAGADGLPGRCHALADGDVDADGANGQHGLRAAYRVDNHGSELLGNGGMGIRPRTSSVVWAASWGPDIALHGADGLPLVLSDGTIPSKTAWRDPAKLENDPKAYADAAYVPYIVVPGPVRMNARGVVLGCRGRLTDTRTRRSIEVGVLDIGPRNKSGEASIAAMAAIGIDPDPRSGGVEAAVLLYEFWPGQPFIFEGFTFALLRG